MKVRTILLTLVLFITLLPGCTKKANQGGQNQGTNQQQEQNQGTNQQQNNADVVTTASIVNNGDAFQEAISKGGTWIIAILSDLTVNKDLVVDGEFKNRKNPPVSQRKLAFYAQDENRKVTARYTLTAPKMTINSPDCAIWYGTFKGDLYVAAKNFQLIGATVDGNIYFTNDEAKSTFKADADSKVTGTQELKK